MYPNLIAELKRKDKKYEDIAKLLDLGITTINEKMNGKSDFKLKELKTMKKAWFPDCSLDYLSLTKVECNKEKETEE